MIQYVKSVAEFLGMIIAYIHLNKVSNILQPILSHIYTGIIRKEFRHLGHNSVISHKSKKMRGLKYISIGDNAQISDGTILTAWDSYMGTKYSPNITIGDNCRLGINSHITAINNITIGNNILTGSNVLITDNAHGSSDENMDISPTLRQLTSKGGITIGDNVWLGNNVCVMGGVTIGNGAIIGANAVVTHNIPPNSVAVGIPAHVIK